MSKNLAEKIRYAIGMTIDGGKYYVSLMPQDAQQAADLIEQQAKELKDLQGAIDFGVKCNDDLQAQLVEPQAKEIAELRKDKERLDFLQSALFREDPLFQFHELRTGPMNDEITLVMFNAQRTKHHLSKTLRQAIDTARNDPA